MKIISICCPRSDHHQSHWRLSSGDRQYQCQISMQAGHLLGSYTRPAFWDGPTIWTTGRINISIVLFWSSVRQLFRGPFTSVFGLAAGGLHLHCGHVGPDGEAGLLMWVDVSACVCVCVRFTVRLCGCVLSVHLDHVGVRMSVWRADSLMCMWEMSSHMWVIVSLLFSLSLCLFFYLSWPGHVQIPTIQQFWRVDCINLNNGSLFPFLSHSQPRWWLQAHTHHGDSCPPWGWW